MATPNVYADQIEWFASRFPLRDKAVISLHTHNDRGTGIAATELALMAGALSAHRPDRCRFGLQGKGAR